MAGDDESGTENAPLAELAGSIAGSGNGHAGDVWEDLDVAGFTSDELWERLGETPEDRGIPSTTDVVPDDPGGPRGWIPEYPSRTVVVTHGIVTIGVLGIAAIVYLSAALGVLPQRYWLLSLPALAAGLFLFVPIVAWVLGLWDPEELS